MKTNKKEKFLKYGLKKHFYNIILKHYKKMIIDVEKEIISEIQYIKKLEKYLTDEEIKEIKTFSDIKYKKYKYREYFTIDELPSEEKLRELNLMFGDLKKEDYNREELLKLSEMFLSNKNGSYVGGGISFLDLIKSEEEEEEDEDEKYTAIMESQVRCNFCDGEGFKKSKNGQYEVCGVCDGEGFIPKESDVFNMEKDFDNFLDNF
jgi:hypothetical protein